MMNFSQQQIDDIKDYIAQLKSSFWGKVIYRYLPFRKEVVLSNLNQVFHHVLSQLEIEKLAHGFYTHFAKSIAENVKMRFMSAEKIESLAILKGHETLLGYANNPEAKGALILTGHFGNWEFSPIAGMLKFKEYQGRIYFIRKLQKIKFIENILFKRFFKAGLRVLPQQNALRDVFDLLEQNNAVVFILDQHAHPDGRKGLSVDFFGKKAGTHRSLAVIAAHSGAPVIPACSYRTPEGKHVLQFGEPLQWIKADDAKQEILINTRAYNQAIEEMVLQHPDQWLWLYKRWKPWKPFNLKELSHG